MKQNNTEDHHERHVTSSSDKPNQPEIQSRRQLIERYGKYAIVGAPLLLFASKARAIHSAP
jgi:hypothetical protein